MRLNLLMIFAIATAAVIPQLALAHLLEGTKGPADAFNYDEGQLRHLDDDCGYAFECKQTDVKDVFFFNCYYDLKSGECQCSKGSFSQCGAARSALAAEGKGAAKGGSGKGVVSLVGAVVADVAKPFKLVYATFAALPLLAKLAVLFMAAAAAIFIFARLRDNAANNLRRAKSLHEKASALHGKGNADEAKLLFEKSNYLREKAYEQMKEKV
ncbi:hypothetical protein HYU20_03525 [Candidatus Woesearchaeota archaeon]|nr:hypothetical protein [Candidatus Woesearchaeota archaeon]